jgi:hypothetical protein
MNPAWDKPRIHALLDAKPAAVVKAIRALAARQTADEIAGHSTRYANGAGFSRHDAPFLTDLLRQVNAGRSLSPRQLEVARNKVKRYWRQLCEIANAREVPALAEVAIEPAVLEALDETVKQVANRERERRDEALAALECGCESMDGERICPRCESRARLKTLFGSW